MARISTSNDPLEKFRFLVSFDLPSGTGLVRAGFHDVQMPKRTTNKIMYREGTDADVNSISAGLSTMEDVVLSRGALADSSAANDFLKWAQAVHPGTKGTTGYSIGASAAAADRGAAAYRSDVQIQMLDREGTIVRAWQLWQAWPTHFAPGSDLNAGEDGDKSMEALTLCYENFQELAVVSGAVTPAAR